MCFRKSGAFVTVQNIAKNVRFFSKNLGIFFGCNLSTDISNFRIKPVSKVGNLVNGIIWKEQFCSRFISNDKNLPKNLFRIFFSIIYYCANCLDFILIWTAGSVPGLNLVFNMISRVVLSSLFLSRGADVQCSCAYVLGFDRRKNAPMSTLCFIRAPREQSDRRVP